METQTTTANIETVQHAFGNFAQGNITGILNACTDDITWSSWSNPVVPFAKTYTGKAGAAIFFTDLNNEVTYTVFEPREFYDCGNRVFVKVYHSAIVKSTGKIFAHESLMEFVFRGEKISRFFAYVDSYEQAQAYVI
jgi:ketosteroid isomerase-like protein